jgi:Tfp pilus assembly protein PilF
MRRLSIAAAALAFSLGVAAQQPAPSLPPNVSRPDALTLRAAQRMQQGDVRGALEDVNEALLRDSHHAGAYALRGSIRMTTGDRAGAIADMSHAIELAPEAEGVEVVHINRARMHWLDGRTAEAARDVDRALFLAPIYPPGLHMRANLKADKGDLDGARIDLDTAIKLSPKMMSAYNSRAIVHLLAGRLQEALSDWKTAMWSMPRDADAVAGHGIARGLLGETAPAMEDLVRARLMDPLSVYPGDRGAASSPAHRLEQYREMNPSDGRAVLMGAMIRALNGDIERARQEVDRALQVDPSLRADAELVRRHLSAPR